MIYKKSLKERFVLSDKEKNIIIVSHIFRFFDLLLKDSSLNIIYSILEARQV